MQPPPTTTPIEATPLQTTLHRHTNTKDAVENDSPQSSSSSSSSIVLHRIVTSASSLIGATTLGGSVADNDDGGDIVASIVLLRPPRIDGDGDGGDGSSGSNTTSSKTVLMVQRMDGTTVASFDLPSTSSFSDDYYFDDSLFGHHNINNNEDQAGGDDWSYLRGRGEKYNDNVLCWASFRDEADNLGGSSSTSTSNTRKMLCALGNSETLLVYDVLGDVHMSLYPSSSSTTFHSSSGVDNNINTKYGKLGRRGSLGGRFSGGGPGGYTIPLPFRARSIFANGDGTGGGLLIVRAPSREDYAVAMDNLPVEPQEVVEEGEDANMDYDGIMAGHSQRQQQRRRRRRRSSTPTTPTGLSLPATPRSSLTRQQRRRCDSTQDRDVDDAVEEEEDHLSLEDPPVPMRYLEKGGTMFVDSGGGAAPHDVLGGSSGRYDDGIDHAGGGGVPCLFSLRHPLDEIHPLAVMVGGTSTKLEMGNDNNDLSLFTNVMETLVFVGSPRLFHGTIPYHATTAASPICVTYNERRNRHTFWSLSDAVYPMETLPLWKTTGRGTWQAVSANDQEIVSSENKYGSHGTQREGVSAAGDNVIPTDNSRIDTQPSSARVLTPMDDEVYNDVDYLEDQLRQLHHQGGVPSSFSDIHPEFALKQLFVEDSTIPPASSGAASNSEGMAHTTFQATRRQIFLATDMSGRGDLVLCIITPTSKSRGHKEGTVDSCMESPAAIVRCFSLHLPDTPIPPPADDAWHHQQGAVSVQFVSHLVDLPCLSAQPVRSIPIPLAPFTRRDSGVDRRSRCHSMKCTSRFHNQDRDTFATDILIVPHHCQAGGGRTLFCLYRSGAIHIADFTLPKSSFDSICPSSSTTPDTIYLENAVGNRVDVRLLLTNGKYRSATAIVRASFSLVMNSSSVTETALRAIESSLVYKYDPLIRKIAKSTLFSSSDLISWNEKEQSRHFSASWWGTTLPLLIRADVVRLFQQTSSRNDGSNGMTINVEDVGWYSFTVVFLNLLGMTRTSNDRQSGALTSRTGKKPNKRQSSAAWEALLQSDYHSLFCEGEGTILFGTMDDLREDSLHTSDLSFSDYEISVERLSFLSYVAKLDLDATDGGGGNCNAPTYSHSYMHLIFDTLHLLHEDSRLVSRSRGLSWTLRLGTLLLHVAKQMNPMMSDYEDHYHRHLGISRCRSNACASYLLPKEEKQRLSTFAISPCIMTCLDSIIQLDADSHSFEDALCWIAGYNGLLQSELNGMFSFTWMVLRLFVIRFDRNNVLSNNKSGNDAKRRERATILAMIDEGIYHPIQLQDELPMGVALPLLEVIISCRLDPPHIDAKLECWPPAAYDLVGRNDLAAFLSQANDDSYHGNHFVDDASPSDDPDNDGIFGMDDFASMTFPDNRIHEAAKLLRSSRPLFLNVPRPVELSDHDYERSKQEKLLLLCRRSISLPLGRGMLTLGTHIVLSAEQLIIPNIVLAGRVPPMNGTLALDMTACPSNFRVWPEFHNGVAAGIRLPQATKDQNARTITRTWIKFNKPMSAIENAGGTSNSAQMPTPSYAHGGFLMALGLRGYLSALTTTDLTDYLTQGIITTTVGIFLGMAANQRGSCDPSVSKMLCLHVPSLLPPSFLPMDLASPVQSAAVAAIGLLYLGSSHRLMTEFLLNEIGRPPAKDQHSHDREGFALVCGLALGMVNLSRGASTVSGLEDLHIEERLHRFISGGTSGSESNGRREHFGVGSQGEVDRNARIYEANSLNRDITAPGATLAIGLMYIRSHNVSVAASLQLPDTHFLLDYIRPDLLGLRVISRSLILWDEIEPTTTWIDSQAPTIVKDSINLMKDAAIRVMKIGSLSDPDPTSRSETETDNHMKNQVTDFDPHAIRQANAYIIAGACFALGLKYAGSANRVAASAIIERTLWLLELRDNKDVVTLTQRPDNSTLITCLSTAAISLAMVMAGTGDLDSFRLFRALHWKCDESTFYGSHMAFGAAIGLLFLGGGKCTLGSSPEDVAMLIASFYPHWPTLTSDNQYHLQALRHLYVLASYKRVLEARDVDSNEKVCIPVELSVANSNDIALAATPFLVANGSAFVQLRSKSDRYNPIVIDARDWNTRGDLPTIFVKRRPGNLSYLQDPNGLLSLSMQHAGKAESLLKAVKLFSDEAILTSFAKYFCCSSFGDDMPFERFCGDIAYDCMKEGKNDGALSIVLRVLRLIDSFGPQMRVDIEKIWDAKMIDTFSSTSQSLLINREHLSLLRERTNDSFRLSSLSFANTHNEKWWESSDCDVGAFLIWTGLPLIIDP